MFSSHKFKLSLNLTSQERHRIAQVNATIQWHGTKDHLPFQHKEQNAINEQVGTYLNVTLPIKESFISYKSH